MSDGPLRVVSARLSSAALEIVAACPQPLSAVVVEPTIVDILGRPISVRAVVPAPGEAAGTVAISAVAPVPPPGADPPSYLLTVGEFSTWFAPASPFALADGAQAGASPPGAASIDYLGRDYTAFTTMMRSRVAQVVEQDSAWAMDHPADPMTTLMEVLAYAGDHLSFRQDAAGTESYLTTARRRLSLRRHARLRDYAVDDGCNARTALVFAVDAVGVLPAGLQIVTLQPGQAEAVLPAAPALAESTAVFETMHAQPVSPQLNDLGPALVQSAAYTVPAGAISLTLEGGGTGLVAGQLVVLRQPVAPTGVASPFGAQVLRLLQVEAVEGQGGAVATVLRWHPEDALQGPLTVPPAKAPGAVSLHGNVVLADHGQTVRAHVHPHTVPATGDYQPLALVRDVVSAAPPSSIAAAFDGSQDMVTASLMVASASASLAPDPCAAAPCIVMKGTRPGMEGVTDVWDARRDLLSCASTERAFAVALEDGFEAGGEQHLRLRFGDGMLGYAPSAGTVFTAKARTGGGQSGRVRADSLCQVIGPAPLVTSVTNPLPAAPSVAEETEAIRLFAPTRFRTNLRGIETGDWERLATADPLVTSVGARFGPDGSAPCTVGLATRETTPGGVAFPVASARLMQYAVLGAPPTIEQAVDIALDIALVAYCASGADVGATRERLSRRLGAGATPDGSPAFFNPANWPLGRHLRLEDLTDAIRSDASVAFIVSDPALDPRVRFETVGGDDMTVANVAAGHVAIGPHQRVRLADAAADTGLGTMRVYVVAAA